MIKPASSLCDMRCAYCFYTDVAACRNTASMGIMSQQVATALISNVFSSLAAKDHVTFAFQGGEPGLAGLDFFRFFTEEVKKATPPRVKVSYAFQTNGLMVNEDWCKFFNVNNFLVGLSLDGDAVLHNRNRVDNQGKGTFNKVMNAKKLFDANGVTYNILCVLTSESSRRAEKIWKFILKEKIQYIQFIPCLEPLEPTEGIGQDIALTSEKFYRFYSSLFVLWKREAEKGNVVSIQLFEDLAALLLARQRVTCGLSGRCTPQIVVEADGSVYPCDFFVLDEYRISDLCSHTLEDVYNGIVGCDFLKNTQQILQECMDCSHKQWCRGGCKRMANAVYGKNCGMKLFLDECLGDLLRVYQALYDPKNR